MIWYSTWSVDIAGVVLPVVNQAPDVLYGHSNTSGSGGLPILE